MIKVSVRNQQENPIDTSILENKLVHFLKSKLPQGDVEMEVTIIDTFEMKRLGKNYLKETDTLPHNVLSFTNSEVKGDFVFPPGKLRNLGEVAVCYEVAYKEAKLEEKKVEDKIYELAEHGTLHLLGEHHN